MTDTYQRRVVCAANRSNTSGALILGARHWDFQMRFQKSLYPNYMKFDEQGFIDQHGVFMTRTEAWRVAEDAGQIIRRVGGDDTNGGTLYSENLY